MTCQVRNRMQQKATEEGCLNENMKGPSLNTLTVDRETQEHQQEKLRYINKMRA